MHARRHSFFPRFSFFSIFSPIRFLFCVSLAGRLLLHTADIAGSEN